STHPSPHMRLSQIPNDNREFHKWVAKMEFVFADIRAGQNLENSLEEIREALKKYPDNKEFLKAEATCLHKIWLNTVPFDEQQLRSILSIPSFKDSMISSDSSRKATNKIPGDKIKYMKALSAYHKAINLSQDPYFISNYSTLIVYSNKKESRDMAVILSELSANVNPDIQTINNLALVYFISGEKRELAYDLFNKLIFKISHLHSLYPGIKEEATNTQKLYSAMNSKYVSPNYTPALNLALTSIYLRKKEAHTIAKIYIQNIESKSEWAGFLSVLSGVEIPEDNLGNKVFSFQKLKIGSDESLINKIIKEKPLLSVPIEETKDGIKLSGKRNIYSETGISITTLSGKISIIEFFKNGQGLDKKIRIGKSEKEIIKSLKTKSQKRGKYNIYYGIKNNLAIQFENGKVKQIVLFN
ncbi:MAG: hypothetical protein KDK36_00080, partial [Leptospiraceae bacterium]|nr:hypothetical protein [Leptospiraceae bacterium]